MEITLVLTSLMGVAIAALFFLYNKAKDSARDLEARISGMQITIRTLEKQNETLAKAAKSTNPNYDIDKLFTGGF